MGRVYQICVVDNGGKLKLLVGLPQRPHHKTYYKFEWMNEAMNNVNTIKEKICELNI